MERYVCVYIYIFFFLSLYYALLTSVALSINNLVLQLNLQQHCYPLEKSHYSISNHKLSNYTQSGIELFGTHLLVDFNVYI